MSDKFIFLMAQLAKEAGVYDETKLHTIGVKGASSTLNLLTEGWRTVGIEALGPGDETYVLLEK